MGVVLTYSLRCGCLSFSDVTLNVVLSITQVLSQMITMLAQVEQNMNTTERLVCLDL